MLESSEEDEEGFHPQQLEIYKLGFTRDSVNGKIMYEPANELILPNRSTELVARSLKHGPRLKQLPYKLNEYTSNKHICTMDSQSIKQTPIGMWALQPNQLQNIEQQQKRFNGNGKFLQQFFVQTTYTCLYRKKQKNLNVEQKARIHLGSPYDYDPKQFTDLAEASSLSATKTQHEKLGIAFDSTFESGNLSLVYIPKATPNYYYLILDDDTNTHGYNEWFFFRVSNLPAAVITFCIVNMHKKTSLYTSGFKVSAWSQANQQQGWLKIGDNIDYYNSRLKRKSQSAQCYYYCISFEYRPVKVQDTIYFALNPPYTFSRLSNFLDGIKPLSKDNDMCMTRQIIGYTHSNNPLIALKISKLKASYKKSKIVVVMARQHPEQTAGSFVCEGFVETLLNGTALSMELIGMYTFVILPMINPDGVIYGNSRCNLAGLDINRQWGPNSIKQLNPQTYFVKKYLRSLQKDNSASIHYFFDLHAHSKKKGCFMYGCQLDSQVSTRLFPFVMSKIEKSFDFTSCQYGQTYDKINTLRCQLFSQIKRNCLTLQTSFYGWSNKQGVMFNYDEKSLNAIGCSLVESLFVISCSDKITTKLKGFSLKALKAELTSKIEFLKRYESIYNIKSPDNQSESQPDADIFTQSEQMEAFGICQNTSIPQVVELNTPMKITKSSALEHSTKLLDLKRKRKLRISNSVISQDFKDQQLPKDNNQNYIIQQLSNRPNSKIYQKRIFQHQRNNSTIISDFRRSYFAPQEKKIKSAKRSEQIVQRENELIVNRLINGKDNSADKFQSITSMRQLPSRYINYSVYKEKHKIFSNKYQRRKTPSEYIQLTTKKPDLNSLFGTLQYALSSPSRAKPPVKPKVYDFPLF